MADIRIFAHRGANRFFTEHTRAAYLQAIALGADGLETDVRLTADGEVVCWHDATLERITGSDVRVDQSTLADLRALDLVRGRSLPDGYGGPGDQIVTLAELLQLMLAAGRPLALALEIKQPSADAGDLDDAVLAVLDQAGWDPRTGALGSVTIDLMCFWPQTVASLRSHVADDVLSLLIEEAPTEMLERWVTHETGGRYTSGSAGGDVADAVLFRDELLAEPSIGLGPDIALVRADPDFYKGWAAAGRRIRVWTVNDAADARLCAELGITELTTDVPDQLRDALGDH